MIRYFSVMAFLQRSTSLTWTTMSGCSHRHSRCIYSCLFLRKKIYAGIVGECAWQEGGCPITQQNYIDFVYGALSDLNSTEWPS